MAASVRLLAVAACMLLAQVASASASVVWSAGAEKPLLQEWANYSCQDSTRITRVTFPSAQGHYAYRVNLNDGDNSFGERCEMAMGSPTRAGFPVFSPGDDTWIGYQVYIPASFPEDGDKYNEITQFKQVNDLCAPALSLHVEQNQLLLFHSADNRSSCGGRSVWSAPMAYDRWIKLLYHVKWSSDPSVGFVELWGDIDGSGMTQLMPRTSMFTMKMDSSGSTQPVDARLGIYRDSSIAGDATAYFDGFTIATDRASAEDGAFGPGQATPLPIDTPPLPAPPGPVPDPGAQDNTPPPSGSGNGTGADPSVGQASAQSRNCRVPRVVHHRLRAAHLMLKRAGCDTRRAVRRRSSQGDRGLVLRQSVAPGTLVPAGTVVKLEVGRGRH
jgi:hypothetical protein